MSPSRLDVTHVSWTAAGVADAQAGLLAFLQVELCGAVVISATLRRTAAGRLALSFPMRTDRRGARHPIIRSTDAQARRELERQVFERLGLGAGDVGQVAP